MPRVYITDLDGTLLAPNGRLSEFSRRHLTALIDAGLPFTVASARSAVSMRDCLGDLRLPLPAICFNGGFVSDLHTGRHLHVFAIRPDAVHTAWRLARARGMVPLVSTTDGVSEDRIFISGVANPGVQMYIDGRKRNKDPRLRFVDDPEAGLDQRVTCLTIIDRRDALDPLAAEIVAALGDGVQLHLFDDLYTVGWSWITLHAGGSAKDVAARIVLDECGLGDHELVAFGDQENDIPLISAAAHGVAVANAIPALKAIADEVIGHHADDAVVRWLLERSQAD